MRRARLVPYLVEAIGEDVAELVRQDRGWPSLVEVSTADGPVQVSFHVAEVSRHSRFKDKVETAQPYEWRFQNPGNKSPVTRLPRSVVALVGRDVVGDRDILIAVDGASRVGRATRFPILFDKRISQEAAALGWGEQTTTSGETIYAMRPHLFPVFIELLKAGVGLPSAAIVNAAQASGLLDDQEDAASAAGRARQIVSRLVRSQAFSSKVKDAYQHRCALCRLGLGLVVGAHILPVQAPGAPDKVWNGLSLCQNHHSAFDSFNIWIANDYAIRINPAYVERAADEAESRRFLEQTRPVLWLPRSSANRPRLDMLAKRYDYYKSNYAWAAG